ncbi:hypothetical protein GOV03_02530 [Candidatus Woesearchaeota archaeon]|nr:hypothetical protein [Candidatus Woesearchaeota archaeon]
MAVKQLRYYGFRFGGLINADNREYYREALERNPWDKGALAYVGFCKLVKPGEPFTRLSAHKVTVYKVSEPQWVSYGNFSVPEGKLETLIEVDLGVEFLTAITGKREIVVEENAEYRFPDRSVIRGPRTKLILGESRLEELEDFFTVQYNPRDCKRKTKEFEYKFGIKKEIANFNRPLEIHIEEYVTLNGKPWRSKTEIALVAKNRPKESFIRTRPLPIIPRFIYRKTSPNLLPNLLS